MSIVSLDTRPAEVGDANGISLVHDASWRQAYTGLIPHQSLDTMVRRRDVQWWNRAIKNGTRILVLEADNKIIGYATVGSNRVSALPQQGEVYELYVLPEYQGVGLGKNLFLEARRTLKRLGMSGTVVWVLEDNAPAMQFYQNAGGQDVAEGSETFHGKTLKKVAYCWG